MSNPEVEVCTACRLTLPQGATRCPACTTWQTRSSVRWPDVLSIVLLILLLVGGIMVLNGDLVVPISVDSGF